jgi:hypothetical protein
MFAEILGLTVINVGGDYVEGSTLFLSPHNSTIVLGTLQFDNGIPSFT